MYRTQNKYQTASRFTALMFLKTKIGKCTFLLLKLPSFLSPYRYRCKAKNREGIWNSGVWVKRVFNSIVSKPPVGDFIDELLPCDPNEFIMTLQDRIYASTATCKYMFICGKQLFLRDWDWSNWWQWCQEKESFTFVREAQIWGVQEKSSWMWLCMCAIGEKFSNFRCHLYETKKGPKSRRKELGYVTNAWNASSTFVTICVIFPFIVNSFAGKTWNLATLFSF